MQALRQLKFTWKNTDTMHINIWHILAATGLSYVLGSLWYLMLGKRWRNALGWREDGPAYRPTGFELAVGFVGQLIMAIALSGLLFHMGFATLRRGALTGLGIWTGFVLPTLATNVIFQRRSRNLIWQDGLHWLLLLVAQGGMLGYLSYLG